MAHWHSGMPFLTARLALALLLPLSELLASAVSSWYWLAVGGQLLFYLAAWRGWRAAGQARSHPLLVIALFFTMMNVAVFLGFRRYWRKSQPAAWAKAGRQPEIAPALSENA